MAISFDDEHRLVVELHALLKAEQQALVDNDIEAIESMLDKKAELIQALSLKSHVRYQKLASEGYSADEDGMANWLIKQSQNTARSAWMGLQKLLTEAKELNRVNGMLVGKFLSRNQQVLNLIKNGGNNAASLYGPNGQSTFGRQSRGVVLG